MTSLKSQLNEALLKQGHPVTKGASVTTADFTFTNTSNSTIYLGVMVEEESEEEKAVRKIVEEYYES